MSTHENNSQSLSNPKWRRDCRPHEPTMPEDFHGTLADLMRLGLVTRSEMTGRTVTHHLPPGMRETIARLRAEGGGAELASVSRAVDRGLNVLNGPEGAS